MSMRALSFENARHHVTAMGSGRVWAADVTQLLAPKIGSAASRQALTGLLGTSHKEGSKAMRESAQPKSTETAGREFVSELLRHFRQDRPESRGDGLDSGGVRVAGLIQTLAPKITNHGAAP